MIRDFINMTPAREFPCYAGPNLPVSGMLCELFAGEVDKMDRMDIVDRFQDPAGDLSIMLVSTLAGGVGLNLTAVSASMCRR